jgi:hypothetical protein
MTKRSTHNVLSSSTAPLLPNASKTLPSASVYLAAGGSACQARQQLELSQAELSAAGPGRADLQELAAAQTRRVAQLQAELLAAEAARAELKERADALERTLCGAERYGITLRPQRAGCSSHVVPDNQVLLEKHKPDAWK